MLFSDLIKLRDIDLYDKWDPFNGKFRKLEKNILQQAFEGHHTYITDSFEHPEIEGDFEGITDWCKRNGIKGEMIGPHTIRGDYYLFKFSW